MAENGIVGNFAQTDITIQTYLELKGVYQSFHASRYFLSQSGED
jgi:hypothetical protein